MDGTYLMAIVRSAIHGWTDLSMASLFDGAHMKEHEKKNVPRSQNVLYTHMCVLHRMKHSSTCCAMQGGNLFKLFELSFDK